MAYLTGADCSTFLCNDGECLPYSHWVCDGYRDCTGDEDEDGSDKGTKRRSPSTEQGTVTLHTKTIHQH